MFDVRERLIGLFPDRATKAKPEIDSLVFGVVSSAPLAKGACTTRGWSSPGRPFLFIEGPLPEERLGKGMGWHAGTLCIRHRGFEIWFWPTSGYWRNLVELETLQHERIVCVRKESGEVITWDEFNELKDVVEAFLGWVNHCVSPVFHLKAYMRGRLVYRGYSLHPHPTVRRDSFSWLPEFGPEGRVRRHGDMVGHAFEVFSRKWEACEQGEGLLHIALQFLRSKEKGSPGSRASLLYLRDAFSAISILTAMLVGSKPNRGRPQVMLECLRSLNVQNRLPVEESREYLSRSHRELWESKDGRVQEDERRKGALSRPMANMQNWLVHLEDGRSADRLLGLNGPTQNYFVQVATWLADLMLMKVVGYEGTYVNRLTGGVEAVPWVHECEWSQLEPPA